LKSDYEATASCAIAFLNSINKIKYKNHGIQYPFQLFSFNDIKEDIGDVITSYDESA
jgi:hypothetical protein